MATVIGDLGILIQTQENNTAAAIDGATNALTRMKRSTNGAAKSVKQLAAENRSAIGAAKSHASALKTLADSVKRIAFYRVIRSAIKEVGVAIKEGTNNLVLYSAALNSLDSARANNTMSEFATTALYVKNSIGAALMPILQALVPVVNAVADSFIYLINAINQLVHIVKGEGTFTKAKRYAVDYAEQLGKASGAAKELKKQVFGFDELNIFNAPSSGGGGGGASGLDYSKMFEEAEVGDWGKLPNMIKAHLAEITGYVSTAMLAVGAILTLSGINPGLGIPMMVAGVIGIMASSLHWNGMNEKVKSALVSIETFVGGAFLALGAILTLSGANPILGIGLILTGALTLGSAASLNWDSMENTINDKIAVITGIVSIAFLALGAILALSGNVPLGIGLLTMGAAGLATSIGMSDTLKNLISDHLEQIALVVGVAFLALGAILAFIPGMMPVGLGLLALGAASLVGSLMMNDKLRNEIQTRFQDIEAILGLSFAGIGAALVFVNPALGIPLLIGGLGLVAASLDWDALHKKITEKWEAIKQKARSIKGDIQGFVESIKQYFRDLLNFNATLKVSSQDASPKLNAYGYERRASGGSVDTGTFFLAGESGPELVGQVGSRTTVTNNEQFTAGMEGIMDNTNTVIMQVGQALINTLANLDMSPVVNIGEKDIVRAYDRGKRLVGTPLVE